MMTMPDDETAQGEGEALKGRLQSIAWDVRPTDLDLQRIETIVGCWLRDFPWDAAGKSREGGSHSDPASAMSGSGAVRGDLYGTSVETQEPVPTPSGAPAPADREGPAGGDEAVRNAVNRAVRRGLAYASRHPQTIPAEVIVRHVMASLAAVPVPDTALRAAVEALAEVPRHLDEHDCFKSWCPHCARRDMARDYAESLRAALAADDKPNE